MSHAKFDIPKLSSLGDTASWKDGTAPLGEIHLDKPRGGRGFDLNGSLGDLNVLLQYGLVNGFPTLIKQLGELNHLLHGRSISDAGVYLTLGNTDGRCFSWSS